MLKTIKAIPPCTSSAPQKWASSSSLKAPTLNTKNWEGKILPLISSILNYSGAPRLLIEKGADLHAVDNLKVSTLAHAISQSHTNLALFLIDAGVSIEAKDLSGRSVLEYAIGKNNEIVVRKLIDKGAPATVKSADRGTLLHCAAGDASPAIVQLLIEKGLDVNAKAERTGRTPLVEAVHQSSLANTKLLVEKGADVNAKDVYGTALHLAAGGGRDLAIVRYLRKRRRYQCGR